MTIPAAVAAFATASPAAALSRITREPQAALNQVDDVRQLRGRDPDCVKDVRHALGEEILGFLESRDGDAPGLADERAPHHIDGLHRLDMGTQADAEVRQMRAHSGDVALENGLIEQQGRSLEILDDVVMSKA